MGTILGGSALGDLKITEKDPIPLYDVLAQRPRMPQESTCRIEALSGRMASPVRVLVDNLARKALAIPRGMRRRCRGTDSIGRGRRPRLASIFIPQLVSTPLLKHLTFEAIAQSAESTPHLRLVLSHALPSIATQGPDPQAAGLHVCLTSYHAAKRVTRKATPDAILTYSFETFLRSSAVASWSSESTLSGTLNASKKLVMKGGDSTSLFGTFGCGS
ncbi:hypothetical protein BV25DRAFT_1946447 [Artomyces pyxidatus]|uniref:Uncharacterized protein n=1 Tax=Artomyces pyxidatus TaxID=48021 RepID=A0ACB8T097_9AGAM|nr:hypothetical protein BV25DRAFT_1946447 [Artomyces pyxidatus]